jgi:hypothetical protein
MPPSYHLLPRGANSNGTFNSNLSDGAIIVIVLVAAGFAVLVGFSITRFYFDEESPGKDIAVGDEQLRYMHSVRQRNMRNLGLEMGIKDGRRSSGSQFSNVDFGSGDCRDGMC